MPNDCENVLTVFFPMLKMKYGDEAFKLLKKAIEKHPGFLPELGRVDEGFTGSSTRRIFRFYTAWTPLSMEEFTKLVISIFDDSEERHGLGFMMRVRYKKRYTPDPRDGKIIETIKPSKEDDLSDFIRAKLAWNEPAMLGCGTWKIGKDDTTSVIVHGISWPTYLDIPDPDQTWYDEEGKEIIPPQEPIPNGRYLKFLKREGLSFEYDDPEETFKAFLEPPVLTEKETFFRKKW